jgi:hypothetical protein
MTVLLLSFDYCEPETYLVHELTLTTTLCHHHSIRLMEKQAQRGEVPCLWFHSWQVAEPKISCSLLPNFLLASGKTEPRINKLCIIAVFPGYPEEGL